MFNLALTDADLVEISLVDFVEQCTLLCPVNGPSGSCQHFGDPILNCVPLLTRLKLVELCRTTFTEASICPRAREIAKAVITQMDFLMLNTLVNKDSRGAAKLKPVMANAKLDRMDEDLKAFVTNGARSSGRAATPGAAAIAYLDACSAGSSRQWVSA